MCKRHQAATFSAVEPLSLCPSRRVGDSTQHELGLVLLSLWKLGEHVYDLVVPAALLCRLRIDVAQSSPDAQVSVSNHQPRAAQAPALDVPEHLGPVLCGLPVSGNSAPTTLLPSLSAAITTSTAAFSFSRPALT